MKRAELKKFYVDGECEPNGNGVWAFTCEDPFLEVSGSVEGTTANRMELTALIKAIEFVLEHKMGECHIFSNSIYAVQGFNIWLFTWDAEKWAKVSNASLWRRLYELQPKARVSLVKGGGDEYVTSLCYSEYKKSFGVKLEHAFVK